jgi:hypothetical protein
MSNNIKLKEILSELGLSEDKIKQILSLRKWLKETFNIKERIHEKGLFKEYTRHDVEHSENVLGNILKLLKFIHTIDKNGEKKTLRDYFKEKYPDYLEYLAYSAYLHDIGMAVYKLSEDYELSKYAELLDIDAFIKNREKGDYKEYLQKMSEVLESFFDRDKRDKYLEPIKNDFYELIRLKSREDQYKNKLKDFIRKYHHILSAIFIYHMKSIKRRGDRIGDNEGHLISEIFDTTNSEKIYELNKMLEKVAIICLGHRQIDLKDLRDVEGTDTKVIRICSAILKLADELEINKDRIRDLKKEYIKNDKEAIEHIGKDVITYVEINHKNYEIILNTDLNTLERDFKIELTDSNLVGIAKKVKDTVNKVKEFINELNSLFMDYDDFKPFVGSILPIHVKDNIADKNLRYEDSDLFRVNIKGIIDLFIGEYLYKDRYVCIRELIQNSIDAYRDLGKMKEIKEIGHK